MVSIYWASQKKKRKGGGGGERKKKEAASLGSGRSECGASAIPRITFCEARIAEQSAPRSFSLLVSEGGDAARGCEPLSRGFGGGGFVRRSGAAFNAFDVW